MRVFIADDSNILRSCLKEILSEFKEIEIVGQAGQAQEALESIRKLLPEVAILDIRFPDGSGIDVLETIKKRKCSHEGHYIHKLSLSPVPQKMLRCRGRLLLLQGH